MQPEAHVPSLPIPAGQGTPLPGVSGPSLDVSFCLRQGQSSRAGLLLRPWLRADSADAAPTAAALVVDWHAKSLQVGISVPFELRDLNASIFSEPHSQARTGGRPLPSSALALVAAVLQATEMHSL